MKDMHAATPILSIIGLFLLWILCATLTADPSVLPQPWSLFPPAAREIGSGELPFHLGATLLRVIWAFALAMTIGIALGLVMGRSESLNRWLDPWLVIFLNLPALVLIVLCYLWIGLNETAAILAVTLNKIPNVATVIRGGARAVEAALDALARGSRIPRLAGPRQGTSGRSGRHGAGLPDVLAGPDAPRHAAATCALHHRRCTVRRGGDLENRSGGRISWPFQRRWIPNSFVLSAV